MQVVDFDAMAAWGSTAGGTQILRWYYMVQFMVNKYKKLKVGIVSYRLKSNIR